MEQAVTYLLVKSKCHVLPTDLDAVARSLRVSKITYGKIAAEGFVESDNLGGYQISIRIDRSLQRRRFSLAHELGHVLLNRMMDRPDAAISRQYRAHAQVAAKLDEEAIVDYIAGMLLLPPWALTRSLPESFSMQTVTQLARTAECSLPTALIRSIWQATSDCFAFHLRATRGRENSLRVLWVRTSRSIDHIDSLCALATLKSTGVIRWVVDGIDPRYCQDCDEGAIDRVQAMARDDGDQRIIYGIAWLHRTRASQAGLTRDKHLYQVTRGQNEGAAK